MLKSTAMAQGADCIWAGYFFHLTYPVCWAAAHLAKKRETTLHAPQGIGKRLHRLIAGLMTLDYCMLPARMPGMSALACFSIRRSN